MEKKDQTNEVPAVDPILAQREAEAERMKSRWLAGEDL